MAVYLITGVSKGMGFEFLKQISEDPSNVVIGLVRDNVATVEKVKKEVGERPNVHILHGDLTNFASLEQAGADTAKIVGNRGIDYLVANAAFPSQFDHFNPIGELAGKVNELNSVSAKLFQTNVVGNIHLFHVFVPLVLKGKAKKVITITSGHADLDLINNYGFDKASLYAASKAAMNVIVAKFNAQYKKDGVLFMSICPGAVEVGHFDNATPEQLQSLMGDAAKFKAYAPDFKGPAPVNEAVRDIRSTWERATIEGGFGGSFVSHHGTKQWL